MSPEQAKVLDKIIEEVSNMSSAEFQQYVKQKKDLYLSSALRQVQQTIDEEHSMNLPEHHEILKLAREQSIDFSRAQFSGVLECNTDEYTIVDLVHAALKQWGNTGHCTKPTQPTQEPQTVQAAQGYLYDFVIDGFLVRDWFTTDYNEVLLSNGINVRPLVLASDKACEQLNQIVQKKATKKTQANQTKLESAHNRAKNQPFLQRFKQSVESTESTKSTETVQTETDWKPIDTAPKDGTLILVTGYNFGDSTAGRHYVVATYRDGHFEEHTDLGVIATPLLFLTHWKNIGFKDD